MGVLVPVNEGCNEARQHFLPPYCHLTLAYTRILKTIHSYDLRFTFSKLGPRDCVGYILEMLASE